MAKHRCPYYVKLDEDILRDPDIMELIDEGGYEALGIYLAILTCIRTFEATDYMIPEQKLKLFANKVLTLHQVRLKKALDLMVRCHLISVEEKNGERFFFSKRRREELNAQNRVRQKQSEGGKKGMESKYGYKSTYK